jgi:hypothetical protein
MSDSNLLLIVLIILILVSALSYFIIKFYRPNISRRILFFLSSITAPIGLLGFVILYDYFNPPNYELNPDLDNPFVYFGRDFDSDLLIVYIFLLIIFWMPSLATVFLLNLFAGKK